MCFPDPIIACDGKASSKQITGCVGERLQKLRSSGGLFIDQLDYKSDEEGEQQGRYADDSPKWREAPGKFDDTVSEQVDGDEGQNQEEEADIFAAEYLHEGESVAGADPEFAVGD